MNCLSNIRVFLGLTYCLSTPLISLAQQHFVDMDEAYHALKIFNYFKAREIFLKEKTQHPFLSSFGLSEIYRRSDNPFSDLDSAYHYLEVAEISLVKRNKSQRDELKKFLKKWLFQTNLKQLVARSDTIVSKIYKSLLLRKDIAPAEIDRFVKKYHRMSIPLKLEAYQFRDSLAFDRAFEDHTALAMRQFLTYYPMSEQFDTAQHLYQNWLYHEKTATKTPESYRRFALMYPTSPYADSAYHVLFSISTPNGTPQEYYRYVKAYPNTPYTELAWRALYGKYFVEYSADEFERFLYDYPEYPYVDEIEQDKVIFKKTLFLVHKEGFYGFIDTLGNEVLPFEYRFARDFHQGLALASTDQRVGYIDKKGAFRIPMIYDEGEPAQDGRVVVDSAFHLGVIDLSHRVVIPFHFEKITPQPNGLFLTYQGQNYRFYNREGKPLFEDYSFATSFQNGYAVVGKQHKKGLIDLQGKSVFSISYQEIEPLSQEKSTSFYRVKKNRKWGIISPRDKALVPIKYDYIGSLSGGRILFVKGKKYGYFDPKGKVAIRPKFRVRKGYRQYARFETFARVKNSKGNYGLIDKRGKKVFPSIFEEIGAVSALPLPVKRKGKWGFVDRRLKMLAHRYEALSPFESGAAWARRKGGQYELLKSIPLKRGFAIEQHTAATYDHLQRLRGKLWLFGKGAFYGVLDLEQKKTVIPAQYTKVEIYPEDRDILRLYRGEDMDYYHLGQGRYIYQTPQL